MKVIKFFAAMFAVSAAMLTVSCTSSDENPAAPVAPQVTVESTSAKAEASVSSLKAEAAAAEDGKAVISATDKDGVTTEVTISEEAIDGAKGIEEGQSIGVEVAKTVETTVEAEGTSTTATIETTFEIELNPKTAEFAEPVELALKVSDPDGTVYEVDDLQTRVQKGDKLVVKGGYIRFQVKDFSKKVVLVAERKIVNGHSGGQGK